MKLLLNVGYVALGAAIGGALRYLATVYIQQRAGPGFPVATMLINITGSLLLGFLVAYLADTAVLSPQLGLFLTTGICGGYTTFSTFSYETFALMRDGEFGRAGLYVALSVGLSLAAMFAGFAAARGAIHLQRGGA
ncbi:MAG: fluoride efflux transporter CrcB [Gemmatimonadota bacterium]|nr:fluoride efflux transporter CrcB [Gemmatimonadota bacterium]MDE3173070.1 fluoride efflux transporter CrcB [Gemmatimonadota bacterium]MDE3215844.1 fluoride efflux transporter CrcB [Gemmatimonadota bacterium]